MEKICPNCKTVVDSSERFCYKCGTKITNEEKPIESPKDNQKDNGSFIGEGARINAMGGISQTNTHQKNIHAEQIDQSQNIIYNKEKKEFCEICGNPFEEKHARCPKCGKEICLDCKVKGKNRCIDCEKIALDNYRTAYQQALFTSNGIISPTIRQMMNQKARELDVEDKKEIIENEIQKTYKPSPKAEQPEVIPASIATAAIGSVAHESATAKGIGSLSGKNIKVPENKKKNNIGLWSFICVLVVIVGAIFLFRNGEESAEQPQPSTQQVEQAEQTENKKSDTNISTQPVKQTIKTTEKAENINVPAENVIKKDTNYENGMKAYEAANGLEAINAFKKSGTAKAYYMIGIIYENGCGNVGKNAMLARKNFKKAAQMGSAEAKAKL